MSPSHSNAAFCSTADRQGQEATVFGKRSVLRHPYSSLSHRRTASEQQNIPRAGPRRPGHHQQGALVVNKDCLSSPELGGYDGATQGAAVKGGLTHFTSSRFSSGPTPTFLTTHSASAAPAWQTLSPLANIGIVFRCLGFPKRKRANKPYPPGGQRGEQGKQQKWIT